MRQLRPAFQDPLRAQGEILLVALPVRSVEQGAPDRRPGEVRARRAAGTLEGGVEEERAGKKGEKAGV